MTTNWRIGRQAKPSLSYSYEPWFDNALCAGSDSEIFFPNKGQSPERAKSLCRSCPVQAQCLEYALASPVLLYGVWGGLTETERRGLRQPKPEPFPHGTEAGAQRHRRRGETPCVPCRAAAAEKSRLRHARSSV